MCPAVERVGAVETGRQAGLQGEQARRTETHSPAVGEDYYSCGSYIFGLVVCAVCCARWRTFFVAGGPGFLLSAVFVVCLAAELYIYICACAAGLSAKDSGAVFEAVCVACVAVYCCARVCFPFCDFVSPTFFLGGGGKGSVRVCVDDVCGIGGCV